MEVGRRKGRLGEAAGEEAEELSGGGGGREEKRRAEQSIEPEGR